MAKYRHPLWKTSSPPNGSNPFVACIWLSSSYPKPVAFSGSPGDIIADAIILMIEVPDSESRKESLQGQAIKDRDQHVNQE